MNIGKQFKIARIDTELTQKEASEATGITEATISEIENGKTDFKCSTAKKLLDVYGYTLAVIKEG